MAIMPHVLKTTRKRLSSMRKCCRRRLGGSASSIPPVVSRQPRRETPLDLPAAGRVARLRPPVYRTRQRRGRISTRPRASAGEGSAWSVIRPPKHSSPVVSGKMPDRNTICSFAKHQVSGQGLVRQGVSDPGCTPGARAPKSGPCGSAPPKTALACASGPFGEVAPGNPPCRKAGRPASGAKGFAAGVRTLLHGVPRMA